MSVTHGMHVYWYKVCQGYKAPHQNEKPKNEGKNEGYQAESNNNHIR